MTPYDAFLQLPAVIIALAVALPSAVILVITIRHSLRRGPDETFTDLANSTIAIVGGAFIFVGAFAVVTSWDNQSAILSDVTHEFSSLTAMTDTLDGSSIEAPEFRAALADYAAAVLRDEIGASGIVGESTEARLAVGELERSLGELIRDADLSDRQVDTLYSHLDSATEARRDRLAESVPDVPAVINVLLWVSALFSLICIGLFPSTRSHRMKVLYASAAGIVIVTMVVSVLVLETPASTAERVASPIESFEQSLSTD